MDTTKTAGPIALYDTAEAGIFRPDWLERGPIPVPLAWVREKNRLPSRYAHACLHPSLAAGYPESSYLTAVQYVANWEYVRHHGIGLTLLGQSGAGKTHTAAAVANEIVARSGELAPVTVEWLPVAWKLPELLDYRHFGRSEEFYAMRNRLRECALLIVDDLTHAAESAATKEFLFGLYDYRYQRKRPILTTGNALVTATDWSEIAQVFNEPFARRLRQASDGYTFIL